MRAIVTHFDGDPFQLNFWLTLYEKYWRGECDEVHLTITHHKGLISSDVANFNESLLRRFPEIRYSVKEKWELPEMVNSEILKILKADYVGLIESDGFIFGSGVVDQCFRLLEDGQELVAPPYDLINDGYIRGDLQTMGYMRCFLFAQMDLLKKTDLDFMPRTIPANTRLTDEYCTTQDNALDCFGWMSWQLALLKPKTVYTPQVNLHPDNILSPYSNFNWIHVRQMQSSALGLGGGDFHVWIEGQCIVNHVFKLFNENLPDGPAEFTMIKAVVFRLLFWDVMKDKSEIQAFADDYRQVLETVIDYYGLNRSKISEIKGFYKGLMRI